MRKSSSIHRRSGCSERIARGTAIAVKAPPSAIASARGAKRRPANTAAYPIAGSHGYIFAFLDHAQSGSIHALPQNTGITRIIGKSRNPRGRPTEPPPDRGDPPVPTERPSVEGGHVAEPPPEAMGVDCLHGPRDFGAVI